MEWTHLPRAGGIYDQHPDLLDAWDLIFAELAVEEKRKQKDRERDARKVKSQGGKRGRRRS